MYLKVNIFSNSNLEVRQSIAAFFANNFDLTILSGCDFSPPIKYIISNRDKIILVLWGEN